MTDIEAGQQQQMKSSSELDVNDKLTLKTLECQALASRNEAMEATQRATGAYQQLNGFAKSLFQKYGVNEEEFMLDTNLFRFMPRPSNPPPQKA